MPEENYRSVNELMYYRSRRALSVGLMLGFAGCSSPLPMQSFAADGPAFDPVTFFRGSIRSWGVLENRSGEPIEIVMTEGHGEAEGPDGVHFPQRVLAGHDPPTTRDWHMRRVGPGRFEATATDMVGTAHGDSAGRAFHWTWTLKLHQRNPLATVSMDQWWYLQDDGSMLNRTIISKLGVIAAEVSEHFTRTP